MHLFWFQRNYSQWTIWIEPNKRWIQWNLEQTWTTSCIWHLGSLLHDLWLANFMFLSNCLLNASSWIPPGWPRPRAVRSTYFSFRSPDRYDHRPSPNLHHSVIYRSAQLPRFSMHRAPEMPVVLPSGSQTAFAHKLESRLWILKDHPYAFGAHYSINWKQIPLSIRKNVNLAQISL